MLVHFYRFLGKLRRTPARKNKIILLSIIIAAILNIIIWVIIYFRLRPLVIYLPEDQAFIPLHYNIYMGVDRFGRWTQSFILPGLGLLFLLINSLLAVIIYNRKEILSYFLVVATIFIEITLLIASILIVLINI